jgi:hypothetical protein
VGVRDRRRVTQRLLRDDGAARREQAGDPPQDRDRIRLMDEEQPGEGQVEWPAEVSHVEVVHVTDDESHIV